ncbi:MAG: Hpt domain-containing protein, partial [Symbiobacteriaceae bacterium]|nr:Hpt domain-containing protein [Symbiobacteriaceae bacterium]
MFEEMIVSYIEDLRSNLLLLNECLISIQNGQHDTEIVNSVFRVAHTIKGNSAAMEFTKIEKVMHTMEDVLQDVRSGKREMSQDIIDVLFASHDFLEDCLDIINSTHTDDSLDVDDILAKITLVEQGAAAEPVATTPPSMEVAPVIIPDFPFTLDASHPKWQRILDNFEDGFPLYWLKVHLDEECQMKPVRSWLVLDKVNQHAELIASLPPHPGENAYEEGSMEFAGFTINLLAITDRDIEDLTEELQRTIDVVGVSKQELQHDDIMPSTSIPAEQNAQQLMTEVGIALLKCEQTGCDKETLDQLIQLLYRLGAVTVEGVSQVFPAAIDGILTALQEMHDRDELPELGDLLNFSFITNELVKGIQEPAYTHQLAFTNTIEGKLFELPHNAKNTMM